MTETEQFDRMSVKVPSAVVPTLTEAAQLIGTGLSEFIVQAALAKAEAFLDPERTTVLSVADVAHLFDLVDHPCPPNAALIKAFERCKARERNETDEDRAMHDEKWSESERKLSRRVFDAALQAELAEVMADFKARAMAVSAPDELWAIQEFLATTQREIEQKYDYRYSQLILVFARLIREGRIKEEQLHGLSEEKLTTIRRIVSL